MKPPAAMRSISSTDSSTFLKERAVMPPNRSVWPPIRSASTSLDRRAISMASAASSWSASSLAPWETSWKSMPASSSSTSLFSKLAES